MIETVQTPRGPVQAIPLDCAGCTACCTNDAIPLVVGDDPGLYDTETVDGQLRLRRRPNGDCVYLERGVGCRIHDRRPAICRNFDCRRYLAATPRDRRERLKADPAKWIKVFAAARRHSP